MVERFRAVQRSPPIPDSHPQTLQKSKRPVKINSFDFCHVFLNRVQQTVSGSASPQHPPGTINWTLFTCSLRVKRCLANRIWRHSAAMFSRHHLLDGVSIHMLFVEAFFQDILKGDILKGDICKWDLAKM